MIRRAEGSCCCSLTSIPKKVFDAGKYLFVRAIFAALYPPQNTCLKWLCKGFSASQLKTTLHEAFRALEIQGYVTKEITLEKDGKKFHGAMVGKEETLKNGNWIVQVTGRTSPIETSLQDIAQAYLPATQGNLLMINSPNVGSSEGEMTFGTAGEVQSLALTFLEGQGAQRIAWVGHSFGATFLAEAIVRHTFQKNVKYTVIRQMAFHRVSQMASAFTSCSVVGAVVRGAGIDTDECAASRVLAHNGVSDYILQASTNEKLAHRQDFASDGVIPAETCLGAACLEIPSSKIIGLGKVGHADADVWKKTAQLIQAEWLQK